MKTKEQIEQMLKKYHEIKRGLDILKYEIETFPNVYYSEVIESMCYTKPEGEQVSNSGVSDKTSRIALKYRDVAESQKNDALKSMLKHYQVQKSEVDKLEYCISRLPQRLSEIITDIFITQQSWAEVSEKYHISMAMVGKYRKKAIEEIYRLYGVRRSVC